MKSIADPVAENTDFDELLKNWFAMTYLLNNLNRGLGLPDGYPFVLSVTVVRKLRFVHDVVRGKG